MTAAAARRRALAFVAAATVLAVISACGGLEPLSVVQVNALRGVIQPIEREGRLSGGFALLAGAIDAAREEAGGRALVIGNLNFLHGTPEAWFTKGRAVVDLMNEVGFSALVVGPRDFYFGADTLASLSTAAKFPFLSANVVDQEGRTPSYLKPWFYDARSRTGFIGLSPSQLLVQNLVKDVAGLSLLDSVEAASRAAAELRAAGARRIGLFAGGVYWGATPGSPEEVEALALLAIPEIDQYYFGPANATVPDGASVVEAAGLSKLVVVQSGARFLNGERASIVSFPERPADAVFRELPVDSSAASPSGALSQRLSSLRRDLDATMSRHVADARSALSSDLERESAMGNFICDLFREYTGTDAFVLNSGKIRSGFAAGPIDRLDVYNVLPFSGQVVVVEATGEQVLALLERSCTFPGNARAGRGWLQVSGISFAWNPLAPAFSRLVPGSVRIEGLPLESGRTYRIGTEAYIAGGGDGYVEFAELGIHTVENDPRSMLEVLQERLERLGAIEAPPLGRVEERGGN
ncbi:MAG TPA: 5'-nucleotidase C-terminal domain-containing protein [Spirochaetales bacterium]|nr:5'-nucleotidase C-terminal domain-containing protein [Spirochaetales bacterium]